MTENSTSTLTTHVTDMHALINHGLKAIDRQAEHLRRTNSQAEALAAVHESQRVLRGHRIQLAARARDLGGKTSQPLKDLITEQGYRDMARPAMHIDQMVPALVLQALHHDGPAVGPAAERSIMTVRRAWDREATRGGLRGEQTAHGPAA